MVRSSKQSDVQLKTPARGPPEQSRRSRTNHANAVVNVRSDDEDRVGKEQVELDDSEAHREDTDDDGTQRDEQPVERRTPRVAHATYHTPTLRSTITSVDIQPSHSTPGQLSLSSFWGR